MRFFFKLCEYAEMYADWLAQCDAKKLDYCDRDYNWHFFWPDHDDHEFIGENLYWRQLQSSDEIYPGSDVPEFWINEKITAPITFFSESSDVCSECDCNFGSFGSCEFDKQLAHQYYTKRKHIL